MPIGTRPTPERIEGLLSRMRAERTRDTRVARVRWLAAAAIVLVAAAIGFGVVTADRGERQPQVLPSLELVTARFESAVGSGLSGEAVLSPKTWGVSVSLDVSQLEGDGPFKCEVHTAAGQVEQAAIWGPTSTGNAKVIGASSIQADNVSAITVVDRTGKLLGTAELS